MMHFDRLPGWNRPPAAARRMAALAIALGALASMPAASAAEATVHPDKWPVAKSAGLVDPATESKISVLLKQMSVEEKVGQVIQTDIGVIEPEDLRRYPLGSILAGGDSGVHGDERAPPSAWLKLAREFRAVSMEARPGHVPIPVLFGIDAVHGHNNVVGAVLFPHNIGLGAARDPELIRRIGQATAEEVAVTGIDWTFAPTLATPRDVRWGRTYEGYSEDPDIVRRYATAMVEGLQGPAGLAGRLQSGRIAATAKHYLADGGTHFGEDEGDAQVSEDELIRIHAQGYPAAINAGVLTVMASYSSWNGLKMHGSQPLLTTILKGRMGFDGFVIGDWNGHGQLPGCNNDRCPAALNAGLDMFMAPGAWKKLYENTLAEVRSGEVPTARLDDAVRRILRVKFKLGMFDTSRPFEGRTEVLASPAHRALAREAVRKSLVLLKNDGVLPIKASARVLVAGPHSWNVGLQSGGWTISWQGTDTTKKDFPQGETIYAGIKAAVEAGGGKMADGSDDFSVDKPDVAIVVFGEKPYAEMFGDIKLPFFNERAALRDLQQFRSLGIPVVAVFLSGRPLWVNPEINLSNAFVAAWLPGSEGGGIADVLIGDAAGKPRSDFTGKLPFPWPQAATLPPYARDGDSTAAQFPLGYGLSYAHGGDVGRLSENLSGR